MGRPRSLSGLLVVAIGLLLLCATTSGSRHHSTSYHAYGDDLFHAIVPHEHIVMFQDYVDQAQHRAILEGIVQDRVDQQAWRVVPRNNKASMLPSDFAVVQILDPTREGDLLATFADNQLVKRVVAQQQYEHRLQELIIDEERVYNSLSLLLETDTQNATCREGQQLPPGSASFARNSAPFPNFAAGRGTGRRLLDNGFLVTHELHAEYLWDKMYTGSGVKVAVFDTGLADGHSHFLNVKERTDWTDEGTLEDYVGHGTFVAGVIAGTSSECPGFAPDSDLHIFRVFTNGRVSFTSWFLDAFNYAIHSQVDVLNLSIGGPDFMDQPFVEKVWELSANNIVVVSAIGNDGPTYGTLNNPADMLDVIGVGGVDFYDRMSSFSSRGMTTWEIAHGGYGRFKPDVVAFGASVMGSSRGSGCRSLSGTSVASPVVAGVITLLISSVPEEYRADIINPASMKQVLTETSELVQDANVFEQGFGRVNLIGAYEALAAYIPRASVIPAALDLTECPYMWPFCAQPLYHTSMPLVVNTTVLNGMGVAGSFFGEPQWLPGDNGDLLEMAFSYSEILWPWTGYLALHIRVSEEAARFTGEAEGVVRFVIASPPGMGESGPRYTNLQLPVKVSIIPTPDRNVRVLWDQFHNINYPPGFLPSDVLWDATDPFDWNGDHLHTNFRGLFKRLRGLGYYVEVLNQPFTCIDGSLYGTYLIVDPEEEFYPEEAEKLEADMKDGLSAIVLADWFNTEVMDSVKFFDENTNKWWTPETGGSNLPALNTLLDRFGVAFADKVYHGDFVMDGKRSTYGSGASIARFPAGGHLVSMALRDKVAELLSSKDTRREVPVIGLLDLWDATRGQGSGLVVMGDSSCFDDSSSATSCVYLMDHFLHFCQTGQLSDMLLTRASKLTTAHSDGYPLPVRHEQQELYLSHSKVAGMKRHEYLQCATHQYKATKDRLEEDIEWEPLPYLRTGRKQGEKPSLTMTQLIEVNVRAYMLPYIFICVLVVIIVAFVVTRREQSPSRRNPPRSYYPYSRPDSV